MTSGFEYFEVDAGVGVTGRADDLPAAFAETALGMFALLVGRADIEERDVREVRAHAERLEPLLVNWLNECLYVHDVEGFVVRRISFAVFEVGSGAGGEPLRLHAFLHGEELDAARHRAGTPVTRASLHGASVQRVGDGFETRAVLEI